MTGKHYDLYLFLKVGLHMHTVPQNKDKFTINNLFYCCKALIFTHPLVYEFLYGPKHMGTPVHGIISNTKGVFKQLLKESMILQC